VENAVDFAASKVEVEARWSKDDVTVIIADDGAGFPPNVLEQLGEPFVTTRPDQSWEEEAPDNVGMGLGFFIAKTLLERSGARLDLANRPGPQSGAVITVVWPRARFERLVETAMRESV
jgi:two-component system sensor histidine kinase RegB